MGNVRLATDSYLDNEPLSLVYIATHLAEAKKVERTFEELKIAYVLELEEFFYLSVLFMVASYMGLLFFVPTAKHPQCELELKARGLKNTVSLGGE